MRRPVPLLLAFLLLALPVLSALPASVHAAELDASEPVSVHALAVSVADDGGHVGVTARVEAQAVAGGSGRVYIDTKPLAETDMQGSARLAARVAADLLGLDWTDYDYLVVFRSPSTVVGGPSAGGVMALALATSLWNLEHPDDPWTNDEGLAATGTINRDGTVGPVGGVPAKAQGAADAGLSLVLYPAGQEQAVATEAGGEQTVVDMDAHCRSIGIDCRPAATLAELVEASTGVRVEQPAQEVPSTSDLADELGPGVAELVDELERDRDAAEAALDAAGPDPTGRAAVQERIDVASDRLADARAQQEARSYYLAATYSFRGNIEATAARLLVPLEAAGTTEGARDAVDAALAECAAARDAVPDVPRTASDWNRLYGVAAARSRIQQADELAAQAQGLADGATSLDDWRQSIATSAFCVERAGTVGWWAGLPDAFGPGPAVGDLDAVVLDALDEARDAVAYAEAVLGDSGGGALRLAAAQAARDDGDLALALLAAAEAQVQASVVLQTGSGLGVPAAVLDAAEQGAARAIARARSAGAEPVLPVSLVELAGDQENGDRLESLWLARTLALLVAAEPTSPTVTQVGIGRLPHVAAEWTFVAMGLGFLLGGGVVGSVWMGVVATRRPRDDRKL